MGNAKGNGYDKIEIVDAVPAPVPTPVPPSGKIIKGVDVSHYEPDVNWAKAKEMGYEFAIAKCSDGLGSKDNTFDKHRSNANSAGVIFAGGYHFFRFAGISPKEQAAQFFKAFGPINNLSGVPFADFEWDNKTAKEKYGDGKETDAEGNRLFLEFMYECERLFGLAPIIYTGRSFMPKLDPNFSRFKLWVFDYQSKTEPRLPPSWNTWTFWQYTNKVVGREAIVGPGNELDANYFNGSTDELMRLVSK